MLCHSRSVSCSPQGHQGAFAEVGRGTQHLPEGEEPLAEPTPPVRFDDSILAPAVIRGLVGGLSVRAGACFGPIVRGVTVTRGKPVDRHGAAAILEAWRTPPVPGGGFLVQCCLLPCSWWINMMTFVISRTHDIIYGII